MTTCPTCGHAVDTSEIVVSLESNAITVRGSCLKLRPRHAEILAILHKRMPSYVHKHSILHGLCGCDDASEELVGTQICYLRKAIAGLPIKIESRNGLGYRLVLEAA